MLNEERIRLMTRMACYEAGEGRKNVAIGNYFRGDYIGLQVIKSVISATIAYVILFAMFIFYDFEVLCRHLQDGFVWFCKVSDYLLSDLYGDVCIYCIRGLYLSVYKG